MANIIETVPYNFDDIYQGIVSKFQEKGYDSPYEGSNLAQLITVMAYTTSMLNTNTAANINETILTLANKKENILQDARLLGYEAEHTSSYKYKLNINVTETGLIQIPKYSVFEGSGKKYYYIGEDIEVSKTIGDTFTIDVKEGNYKFFENDSNLIYYVEDKQYFDIPILNVEAEGIDVFLTYYNTDGNLVVRENWTRSQILILDKSSKLTKEFIRLDDIKIGAPRIYFEIANIGNRIPTGATIELNILVSSGSNGELLEIPTTDIAKIEVTDYTLLNKGTDEESNESIKMNAPLLNNTASRAVTAGDYQSICNKHSAVRTSKAWGGEDEYPVKLGNIYLCCTPERYNRVFTNNEDNSIYTLQNSTLISNLYLLDEDYRSTSIDSNGRIVDPGVFDVLDEYTLPSLQFNNRNPVYIDTEFTISVVKYNIGTSKVQRREQIFNVLNEYFKIIENFDIEFFKSNVIKRIDTAISDITGIELDVSFKHLLTDKLLVQENGNIYENDIIVYLELPYDSIYDEFGNIIESKLPSIDTLNFKNTSTLTIDLTSYNPDANPDNTKELIEYNIKLGSVVVGKYQIFNKRRTYIRIKLFVKADVLDGFVLSSNYNTTTLLVSDFATPKYMNLSYNTNNFKTGRNSILRLSKCTIN